MIEDTTPEYALAIIRYDWLETGKGKRLHWADLSPDAAVEIIDDGGLCGDIRLACGRTAAWVCIPGMFSRMGAERCSGCCRALGYPAGKGSPKNADAIRPLLGLEPAPKLGVVSS